MTTPQGKVTKNVEVEVLRDVSLSCPPVTKVTPKGKYVFKEMMAGVKAEEPCQAGGPGKVVTYMCSGRGAWTDLDTSACSFTSDLTRRLESMAQVGTCHVIRLSHCSMLTLEFVFVEILQVMKNEKKEERISVKKTRVQRCRGPTAVPTVPFSWRVDFADLTAIPVFPI